MKTKLRSISIGSLLIFASLKSAAQNAIVHPGTDSSQHSQGTGVNPEFQLIWSDEFDSKGNFDSAKWSFCPRGTPAWMQYLTEDARYAIVDGGSLKLKMDAARIAGDPIAYHSGGVQSKGKFNFTYGKVEVRAKFKHGRGSWPAIWMMPDDPAAYGDWPQSGEIDIMEHVNLETVVHQTIHNAQVTGADGGSTATQSAPFKVNGFNIYTIIWTPTDIQFYVNKKRCYTYAKAANGDSRQWPFNQSFYIILNQSGGAGWPGPITPEDLPFTMDIDYVRVYQKTRP